MSRIQQLVRPQPRHRTPAGRIALPLIGIAAACIAFYAQAQIGKDTPGKSTPAPVAAVNATPAVSVTPAARASSASVASIAPVAATPAPSATPAVAPTPVAQVAQVTQVHKFGMDDDAWAIVRKGEQGYSMSGSTDDMDEIAAAKRSLTRDFIWFRRDGQAYVIDDPSIVGRAQAAWKDTEIMGERMSRLGAQMEVHGKKMETLGKQMEKLSEAHRPSPAMMDAQKRMGALGQQQQDLSGQTQLLAMKLNKADSDAEREKIQDDMNALHTEMSKLGEEMEAQGEILERESEKLERNSAPMEALGDQMEEASKPMEALGDQMGELGKQQEKLAKKAEKELGVLIAEGVQKGLAKPAPGARSAQ